LRAFVFIAAASSKARPCRFQRIAWARSAPCPPSPSGIRPTFPSARPASAAHRFGLFVRLCIRPPERYVAWHNRPKSATGAIRGAP